MMDTAANSSVNSVCYCCVWKDGGVVYEYSVGNHEIDAVAASCLKIIPPYHRFYFETISSNTFAFLMDDGFVYFAILRRSTSNSQLLSFLQKLRDEFRRIGVRGSSATLGLQLQEQFLPVVRRLVERVETATAWPAMSSGNGDVEAGSSTKAPLLARPCKQDKKKKDDGGGGGVSDIETPEHNSGRQGTLNKSSSQNRREKWCRQVRIVLAIDAAICVLLFLIWLIICRGIECIR